MVLSVMGQRTTSSTALSTDPACQNLLIGKLGVSFIVRQAIACRLISVGAGGSWSSSLYRLLYIDASLGEPRRGKRSQLASLLADASPPGFYSADTFRAFSAGRLAMWGSIWVYAYVQYEMAKM